MLATIEMQHFYSQKQPLSHKGLDERFSKPIFNKTTIFPEAFNFKEVIREYSERNGMVA